MNAKLLWLDLPTAGILTAGKKDNFHDAIAASRPVDPRHGCGDCVDPAELLSAGRYVIFIQYNAAPYLGVPLVLLTHSFQTHVTDNLFCIHST